jgi:hypothetical protein
MRMYASISLTVAAAATLGISSAFAKPPNDAGDYGLCLDKQLYKFNLIQLLKDRFNRQDSDTGNRIFYSQESGGSYQLIWDYDETQSYNGFKVIDCDGTTDKKGIIGYDSGGKVANVENIDDVVITVALHGPTSNLTDLACTRYLTDNTTTYCLIGSQTYTLEKNFHTTINKNLFDDALDYILWEWNGDWKVMDARVWSTKACPQ